MAIASLTAAWTQYDAALAYDSDPTGATAASLCEAIRYILGHEMSSMGHAGRQFQRFDLQALLADAQKFARAGSATRPSMLARVRVTGLGDGA